MKNKGFTILEILVVLTVLAILIGIAVPRMKGMQDQANIQKAKSEMKTLQTAVEAYYINHSSVYPPSTTTLFGSRLTSETVKIVDHALYDPFAAAAGTEFIYVNNGSYYVLSSVGLLGTGTASAITTAGVVTTLNSVICITNGTGC